MAFSYVELEWTPVSPPTKFPESAPLSATTFTALINVSNTITLTLFASGLKWSALNSPKTASVPSFPPISAPRKSSEGVSPS